ncbi:hypothetical protein C8R43DRAFT_966636 [Mycena crocata]|nr:hypothetical protein C8R43DRAFT_966636 [Mycena crocata]
MYTAHWNPIVVGELSIIPLSQAILLVNWRERTAIILGAPKSHGRPGVGFAGGQLVLNIRDTRIPRRECVAIYSLAVFSEHWQSIDELDFQNHASITEFPRAIVAYPATEGHFFSEIQWSQMSVHASPLRRYAYQITLYLWDYIRVPSSIDSSGRGVVFRYMFTPPKFRGKGQLKLISTFRVRSLIQHHGFTYSGHAIEGGGHKCDVRDSPMRVSLEGGLSHPLPSGHLSLPGAPESIARDISPYSCVLATLTTSGLRISYFS